MPLTSPGNDDGTGENHQPTLRKNTAEPAQQTLKQYREGQLFTFLDEGLASVGPVPPTNNLIESWNARLRDMLRRHRGLRLVRRLKAICWWCHQHTAHPETDAWLAANAMPDERLERLYRQAWERSPQGQYETFGIPARYGTGIDWNEFHTRVEWQSND